MLKKILIALMLIPLSANAAQWNGTVVGVSDGDTIKVLNEQKETIKIRLAEIDAPESSQAFGVQSKQSLSDLCFQKTAIVHDNGKDKYNRTLARVECDGVDVNAEQVKRGMAWAYRQYLKDHLISLIRFEADAKEKGIGLWTNSNPTPPWEYRHGKKSAAVETESSNIITGDDNKNIVTGSKTINPSSNNTGYFTGKRGGCYTYTSGGNKRYVAHSFCGR